MSDPAVVVQGLTHRYGGRLAVDDLSLSLGPGVCAFLGHNGAGKSTTMRAIAGVLVPTLGSVRVCGHDPARDARARRVVGWLPEEPPLHKALTVREQLAFSASLRDLRGATARAAVDDVIARCGLSAEAKRRCGALSKGTRQRVGLAHALLGDPPVLLLDEPTAGLDPVQRAAVRALIASLTNKTVLLSTHLLQEVQAVCSRAVVLRAGRLVLDRAVGSADASPDLQPDLKLERDIVRALEGDLDVDAALLVDEKTDATTDTSTDAAGNAAAGVV